MPLTIRPALLEDGDRLFELLCQLAWSRLPDRQAFDKNYPAIISDRNTFIRVADDDGIVVGYSLAVLQWTFYANGSIALLNELIADSERRGQGIGAQLVSRLIDDAREAGAVEITVPTRRAKDYYPRFGFEEIGGYFKLKL